MWCRPLILCLLAALPLFSQPKRFDAAQVERGRAQFKSSCGFCHGDDATGNRGGKHIPFTVPTELLQAWGVNWVA
jgi:cytochrome c553